MLATAQRIEPGKIIEIRCPAICECYNGPNWSVMGCVMREPDKKAAVFSYISDEELVPKVYTRFGVQR